MNAETIENFIKNLGKVDFDTVAVLVLTKVYHLKLLNVDGKGDAGSDARIFKDLGGSTTAAYQLPVQDAGWKRKALADARKAVEGLKATRFFFLTSRTHEGADLAEVENEIISALKIPANCLGAKQLAGLIVGRGLVPEFLEAIGAPVNVPTSNRPDLKEILLHSYVALGSERAKLRDDVYDDTLMYCLNLRGGAMPKDGLVDAALHLLECPEGRRDLLSRRVDSLLTRGWLRPLPQGQFRLADEQKIAIQGAERLYYAELGVLASAQAQLIYDKCGATWTQDQAHRAGVLLARMFIKCQLDTVRNAALELTALGLVRNIGDPEQDLRDMLSAAGVPPRAVNGVILEFVDLAKEKPLIKKLARAATCVAIEGGDPLAGAKLIGASRWPAVTITLDASVAIPYLCASLYSPTSDRFSQGANECVTDFLGLGAKVVTPWFYIEECSAHLLKALDYGAGADDFQDDFAHSQNGYVAQYYLLRQTGRNVPLSIADYLETFAPSVKRSQGDLRTWTRTVMSELEQQFRHYGVEYEDIPRIPDHFRVEVEREYTYAMNALKRSKSHRLIEHDVMELSHSRRGIAEWGQSRLCLTWDGAMIDVGRKLRDCGWVVSPHEAIDFVQPYRRMSESKMFALAHVLASARDRSRDVAGHILDRVVYLAKERLLDWEFRQKVKDLRDDLLSRIDLSKPRYADWVDQETDKFLRSQGVEVPPDAKEEPN